MLPFVPPPPDSVFIFDLIPSFSPHIHHRVSGPPTHLLTVQPDSRSLDRALPVRESVGVYQELHRRLGELTGDDNNNNDNNDNPRSLNPTRWV